MKGLKTENTLCGTYSGMSDPMVHLLFGTPKYIQTDVFCNSSYFPIFIEAIEYKED